MIRKISEKISKYHFEFRHLTVLLIVMISFQILLSFIQKESLQNFLENTKQWYRKDSAERMANLSTTSLELFVGNMKNDKEHTEVERNKIIQSFNIILSQQLLEPNVEETCLIMLSDNKPYIINDGRDFYIFLQNNQISSIDSNKFLPILNLFLNHLDDIKQNEEIYSFSDDLEVIHILVPFIPFGEFIGAFYMKNQSNLDFITKEILKSYDEVAIIYTSLILLGLLAMYYISSYTVKERDDATQLYYKEQEQHLKDRIEHEKESMFTKRIYHTHHKAEKVMGFIKEDLRLLNQNNIEETKSRVSKYANFISRVIYDMKWYDPPILTIRNQAFSTNINDVISFVVDNLFLRIARSTGTFGFNLNLDKNLPHVNINEFVIWEIIEPLIQNSIDHSKNEKVLVEIITKFDSDNKMSYIIIRDNGGGIDKELLVDNEYGVQKIFVENISSKSKEHGNSGYGCYIAYELATKRCGWNITASNFDQEVSELKISIKNY